MISINNIKPTQNVQQMRQVTKNSRVEKNNFVTAKPNLQGVVNCVRNSNGTITITYYDSTQKDTSVGLTTSAMYWSAKNMTNEGNGLWSITIKSPAAGQTLQYQFIVNGNWTRGNYKQNNIPSALQGTIKNNSYTAPSQNAAATLFTAKVVNCSNTSLNQQPRDNAESLATLSQGTTVDVIGMNGHWYKVSYDGQVGYVNSQYLSETSGNNFKGEIVYDQTGLIVDGQTPAQNNQTSQAIINKANEICANATTNVEKAKAIYVWIAQNISYNYQTENALNNNENVAVQSTATYTFNHRSGICEGYSELYADMCRAEGLQVRLINGISNGGLGNNWAGHAWNQVYLPSLGTPTGWVNVDCTFAASAYTSTSDQGAGEPKGNLSYILNPNTETSYITGVTKKTIGNETITTTHYRTFGHLDYFNNPTNFNASHKEQSIQSQGFGEVQNNNTQVTPIKNTSKTTVGSKIKNSIKKIINS